jgi:hypothetical protein
MGKSRKLKPSENVEFLNINMKYLHVYSRQPGGKNRLGIRMPTEDVATKMELNKLI